MRYIQKAGESYIALIKSIQCISERKVVETRSALTRAILFWSFVIFSVLLLVGVIVILAIASFGRIFFSAMIVYRNVHVSLPSSKFVDRMEGALLGLDARLGFAWVFVLFDAPASLNVSFDFANVTCVGTQANHSADQRHVGYQRHDPDRVRHRSVLRFHLLPGT